MNRAILLATTLMMLATPAVASEPGQRLTCSDFVFTVAGLSAESFVPVISPDTCRADESNDFLQCGRSFPTARLDADGSAYAQQVLVERRELWRTRADGQAELVAHLPTYRPAGAGRYDTALLLDFYVDPVRGSIYVRLATGPAGPGPWAYADGLEVCRITGLVPMVDVIRRQLHLPPGLLRDSP